MNYDFVLFVGVMCLLLLGIGLAPGSGSDTPTGATTATPGPGTVPADVTASATVTATPSPTPSPARTPTLTRTPTPSPTTTPTPRPTPAPTAIPTAMPTPTSQRWPRAEFWHECDSRGSADIYYRVEVLGTRKVTELYGSDDWESNFPRTLKVSATETHELSLEIRGGRWIELYEGKDTSGDPFARYYVGGDACRDYSKGS